MTGLIFVVALKLDYIQSHYLASALLVTLNVQGSILRRSVGDAPTFVWKWLIGETYLQVSDAGCTHGRRGPHRRQRCHDRFRNDGHVKSCVQERETWMSKRLRGEREGRIGGSTAGWGVLGRRTLLQQMIGNTTFIGCLLVSWYRTLGVLG